MVQVIAGAIIAFLITFFLMPFVIRIARINKIYDIPDERKTHTDSISSLGGIGIFIGLTLSLLLISDFQFGDSEFQFLLATFFIIFIIGVIDDIFILKAWKKVFGQLVVSAIITAKAHLLINNLNGFLGINELSPAASYIFTFFTMMVVVNSFNLVDGIDGLAASLGLISCVVFGLFFFINNNIPYALLGFSTAGALLAFLLFNFPPAKIFMGDSGSMMLGLVNAILVINFIKTGSNISLPFPVQSAPALGFGILLIPLMDVLRVFIVRLSLGNSPFAPDRNHLHHIMLNKGLSHTKVTFILMLTSIFFTALSFMLQQAKTNINIIIIIQVCMFFGGMLILNYIIPIRKSLHVVSDLTVQVQEDNVKVFPIYTSKEKAALSEE